ncbi:metallophosphoesterase [candidate division WOR-3 bacterium]|uniref:Metallophosphoesterase n=1 Tax=candidate division WOR-3 bacterium TaxID=2052148 RepID=A0A660SJX8_UNCW3|nr:MAG: metallophosphoesterase [candidate division WOR-3 bacterium]
MIALISDIHSNLEALNRVMEEIDRLGVERIWCLGDVVGYGADPNRCCEIVRERCELVIAGNHDWAVLDKTDITYFNPVAKEAVLWTRRELSGENREFLDRLGLKLKADQYLLVHSSPSRPEEWLYLFEREQFEEEFQAFGEPVCFIGHSHVPVIVDDELKIYGTGVNVEPNHRYIINIGSVGQPRDGDPRASFATIEGDRIEIRRLEYDIETAQEKIRKAGLPEFLAERLAAGR